MDTKDSVEIYKLYLNGQFVEAENPLYVTNPATSEVFAGVGTVPREGVAQALADAQAAWPAWRSLPARLRGEYLFRIADALEHYGAKITRTVTMENGKPLAQSCGELAISVDNLRWYAAEAQRAYGRVVPQQSPDKRHLVVRTPVGVVGAIPPWNFPLALAVRKVAPALAAGCPVVLKPASATPLSALLLAEAIDHVGLPPGVFQVVAGRASEIGAEMLENPLCRKISFTGSTEVGRHLIRDAAGQIKKLSLELGGHAPVLVFGDADLDQAVEGTAMAKFRNTGQSCIAASRVYVDKLIYEKFVSRLVARTKALKIGNGLDDGIDVGPLIDEEALNHSMELIEDAKQRGATIQCGGCRMVGEKKGFFLEPTILTGVPPTARLMREEPFAPILPIASFEEEDEAIAAANDTVYGLAAYAFTRDLSRMWRLAEALEAGTICVNDSVPATSQCPFGGLKQSGWGRELGSEGLDAFYETKHISIMIEP
jgi:succinate-semialdehyde dehydrogenase/glutarate-semialdehyde dehydrogenase